MPTLARWQCCKCSLANARVPRRVPLMQGHLAAELAGRHGLSVLAVDMSDTLVKHAAKPAGRARREAAMGATPAGKATSSGCSDSIGQREGGGSGCGRGRSEASFGGASSSGSGGGSSEGVVVVRRKRTGGGSVQVAAVAATLTAVNVVEVLQRVLAQQAQQDQQGDEGTSQQAQQGPPPPPPAERVILVGLHACSDLTPTLLNAFAAWPAAVVMVSLGYCYNLRTEAAAEGEVGAARGSHGPLEQPGATPGRQPARRSRRCKS
jgi:hypothetical protein